MKICPGTLTPNIPGRQKPSALKKYFQGPGYITEHEATFHPEMSLKTQIQVLALQEQSETIKKVTLQVMKEIEYNRTLT